MFKINMAQRRMFSKSITSSSRFLMMSQSAQNLYFHLGMNADDDGFCEHFSIMRMTESKPDDLKVLQLKGFIHIFDDKVLVIMEWKENNYIQKDRYTPSKYLKLYENEIKILSEGSVDVYKMDTQVRLGKVRLGKDTTTPVGTPSESNPPELFSFTSYLQEMLVSKQKHVQIIGLYWKEKEFMFENIEQTQSALKRDLRPARALSGYLDADIVETMNFLERKKDMPKWTLETVHKYIDDIKQGNL